MAANLKPRYLMTPARWAAAWPWLAGAVLGLVVLGPGLAPGSLFVLDGAFVPRLPVPAGVWGLGPELPRQVPLGVALAWASDLIGGGGVAKVLVVVASAAAFAGVARLAASTPWPARLGAGLVYAASPWMLTRIGAGQLNLVAAAAVLPWALPSLLVPTARPARTFLWALAMGSLGAGYVGGSLALVLVGIGVLAERSWQVLRAAGLVLLAQLPWVVPAIVVLLTAAGTAPGAGLRPAGAEVFATSAHGLVGGAALLAGHGFWRAASQVGGVATVGTAVLGAAMGALAVVGARSLPTPWRWRALAAASLGFLLTVASALPGIRQLYAELSGTPVGLPFRESQRAIVLTLAWLAPASAYGAVRLAHGAARAARWSLAPRRWVVLALPAAAALVLALPGLWGIDGRLHPVGIPSDWVAARRVIERAPGTVVALPFDRYIPLPLAEGRVVVNPLPNELGGDVIGSSDPHLGSGYRESADPREAAVARIAGWARAAQPVAADLARIGVRWVAVLHAAAWQPDARGLAVDPGLQQVIAGETLDLFAVRAWTGPVVVRSGRSVPTQELAAPLRRLAPSSAATWFEPAAAGWMRGLRSTGSTASGLVRLPAGRGFVWFWPAVVVLLVDLLTVVAAGLAWRASRSDRFRTTDGSDGRTRQ